MVNLFINIGDKLSGKNLYYLCADTHNYQTGKVQLPNIPVINQYICGTGGAEQDDCTQKNELTKKNIRYFDIVCNKIFGFLIVSINGDSVSFEFINSHSPEIPAPRHVESQSAGYKKYLKYKQKYITLKKKIEEKN